jgi:hypothetical protein
MNTCTKAVASREQEIEENYTKMLAESMQRTKDMIAKEFFEYAKSRPQGLNEYLHGVTDAIHEIT